MKIRFYYLTPEEYPVKMYVKSWSHASGMEAYHDPKKGAEFDSLDDGYGRANTFQQIMTHLSNLPIQFEVFD